MRLLLACTCLTPVTLYAGAVHAERTVDTKITTPISTSTASNGSPDNIRITANGNVNPSGGTAVTIDSNHSVENLGTIQITGANDATGILANPGFAGNITNSGNITIDESYTPTDGDNDGDIDGPFAQGARRFGIRVAPGGTFTGNIAHNGGTIAVEGNDSAGIAVDSRLQGNFTSNGTINVTGDRSVGIRTSDVTGNVRVAGTINVLGSESIGVALDGDIGGALTIQGSISSTGYRYTTPPSDTSKLDADDLLQGGPALRIAGNVAGGIIFARPPADNSESDTDEDDDGIPDAQEGTANVISRGAAPAVQIGSAAEDIAVGAVAGDANGHGLVINGTVTGAGLYKGVDSTGMQIGGLGGDVTIAGGMTNTSTITAGSVDSNATAVRIGAGATVNEIRNSGQINAGGATLGGKLSQSILIESGATVTTIRNSGQVNAVSGADGGAGAIIDRSGGVSLVENSGRISATGATANSGRNVAIDLSANNAGATVRQTTVGQGVTSPTITGDVLFGAGDDLLDVADGAVTGTTRFGAGANRLQLSGDAAYSGNAVFGAGADRVTLGGTSTFSGSTDFGGGADVLELSGTASFRSNISNTAGLSVNAQGGLFEATNLGTVTLSSLTLGADAALGVNVDAAAGTNTFYDVTGTTTIANGADVRVRLANVSESEGRYVFLRSGTLTGAGGLNLTDSSLPFLFKGALDTATAGEVAVVVTRRTATELGFNGSESRAYDAVFAALDSDEDVADAFLALTNAEGVQATIRQMLPDHAGGAFDAVTQGSRATARFLADPHAPLADMGGWGFWVQQVAWGSSKDLGDTASYDIAGWGTSAGAEIQGGGIGNFGLSLAYLNGEDDDGETNNQVRAEQYELAAHWRGGWGGLRAWARVSAALIDFRGTRVFTGNDGIEEFTRTAKGDWGGQLYSAAAGVSYELGFGRFSLRPLASIDYYRLSEDGYTEEGGGDAFNLIVDDRTSDEFALNATLTVGYDFGRREAGGGWLRTELEAGRRQILGGSLGETTARFKDGDPFTLVPEDRTDGWVGRLRVVGGEGPFSLGGEASAEEQLGKAAIAFRVSLRVGL
ncbi:autotransporter domain-containing protein [Sphingosinicella sp. LHD-64]|uniref:autotransporter outer membrane beta-barrel domain-containing protein n=1 Tax=Sphingosinicella sp. LHD-64 TaxID=3072139 RepID=UPI00280DB0EE|nr:autotransporter domain-containing protein [Sphingosinicella sp. LHD-64]MDQ8754628.1 autotransporter domain-containing protein [Sphingosinicella sp. LHD-64]